MYFPAGLNHTVWVRAMLYIYGAGANGIHAYYMLRRCGQEVHGFIDQDKSKQGYFLDGLNCFTPKILASMREKEKIIIIVCVKQHTDDIVESIKHYGIEHVYTMDEYMIDYLELEIDNYGAMLQDISILKEMQKNFSRAFYENHFIGGLEPELQNICRESSLRKKENECSRNQ